MTKVTSTVIHLAPTQYPRRFRNTRNDNIHEFWWTTSSPLPFTSCSSSDTSVSALPTPVSTPATSQPSANTPGHSGQPSSGLATSTTPATPGSAQTSAIPITITSSLPVTIIESQTTFTSLSQTVYTTTQMATALPASQSVTSELQVSPVCIGDGIDAQSLGLISTVVVPTVIGLVLWVSSRLTTAFHGVHVLPVSIRYFTPTLSSSLCRKRMVCSAGVRQY